MRNTFRNKVIIGLASLFLVSTIADDAHALRLRVTDLVTSIVIADVSDTDGDGMVSFLGSGGGFALHTTIGVSDPLSGSSDNPDLDLLSMHVSGTGHLRVELTDTDFPSLASGLDGFMGMIGGTTAGSVDFSAYYDEANAEFGQGTLITSLGSFSGGAFSGEGLVGSIPLTIPYSLSIVVDITHTSSGNTSFNAEVVPTPEPASLILMGSGLAGLGLWRWRKSKKS